MTEQELEQALIGKLTDLKYIHRPDIRDRAAHEANFRDHFQTLNRVTLTDGEFKRLLDEIVNQLRINTDNSFQRYDVMLLINGIPTVQLELKTLGISSRRAMQQIVGYKKVQDNVMDKEGVLSYY